MATRADVTGVVGSAASASGRAAAAAFARLVGLAFVMSVTLGLLLTAAAVALPAPVDGCDESPAGRCLRPSEAGSGSFFMRRGPGEPWAMAPNLGTEAGIWVRGLVARTKLRQRFRNGTDEWVEGVYVFPLPPQAAVEHLLLRVGERTIEGQTHEREQARAEYRQAGSEGRKAGLVDEERPNVFTTSLANLAPGEELAVEIELQQRLELDRGEVRLRFPLAVGPRHEGLRNLVRIEVDLNAGFQVERLVSRHHPVVTQKRGEGRYRVRLRDELVPADRDYELAWTPKGGALPQVSIVRELHADSTYALVTLFPLEGAAVPSPRPPREGVDPITGVEVSWPIGAGVEAWPQRFPDFYLGEPLVLSARIEGRADQLVVTGQRAGEPWRTVVPLGGGRGGDGARVLWALRKAESLLDSLHEGADPEEVRAEVAALGLEHHLVTRHTSLLAAEVTPAGRPCRER